jgi:hypothetical protein
MIGNLSEWIYETDYISKGGNYLSEPDELEIQFDHPPLPGDTNIGMGCRIILETN